LIVQLDHLEASIIALQMAVIGAQGQLALHRPSALLPELFDGFVIDPLVAFIMDDPGQFAKLEPVIAGFEACQCFDDLVGHLLARAWTEERCMVRKEAEGALVSETPRQLAHGFRVRMGLHGPLRGGPVVKKDEGANHLIAPLDLIDKAELELGKICQRFPLGCSPPLLCEEAGATATRPAGARGTALGRRVPRMQAYAGMRLQEGAL
jgi:hypothetical protein